jgi:hypothetical protein
MAFTFTDWKNRISKRNDITGMLTHLTKPKEVYGMNLSESDINKRAIDNLISILVEKMIKGSNTKSGFIIGDTPAVCFQDAPLHGIIQNVENEIANRLQNKSNKIRYCGNGLLFSKFYAYGKGGRPVIYDMSSDAKKYLPPDQYWRIVNLQLSAEPSIIIDWTHEREWRVPNNFEFEYDLTHIVVYDKETYDYFKEKCDDEILNKLHGITILKSILM